MKRIAVAMLLLSSYCYAQTTDGFALASTNVWGAEYPRVDASGRAEFRIKAPNATAVKLNFWSNPKLDMVKGSDGFWTATTPPLVPGFHYYNFVIDGVDVNDAGSHAVYGGGRDASGTGVTRACKTPSLTRPGMASLLHDNNLATSSGFFELAAALERASAKTCWYAPRSITNPPTVPSELPKTGIFPESNARTTFSLISDDSRFLQRTERKVTVSFPRMEVGF